MKHILFLPLNQHHYSHTHQRSVPFLAAYFARIVTVIIENALTCWCCSLASTLLNFTDDINFIRCFQYIFIHNSDRHSRRR